MAPAPAPTPWFDIAIGGVVSSDYSFRGISQSNRGPSGGAYFEPDFTTPIGVLYIGVAGLAIDWPSSYGFSDPTAEIDFYGGWRNSWGPFSLDIGAIYYYYPKELFNINSDFWEVYGRASYEVVKGLTFGGNVYYTPDLLNYGGTGLLPNKAPGVYASFTGKWVLPWTTGDLGAFISGEFGHWWIERHRLHRSRLCRCELHLLERRPRLHLQGDHARPALPRHRSVADGLCQLPACDDRQPGVQLVQRYVHRRVEIRHHDQRDQVVDVRHLSPSSRRRFLIGAAAFCDRDLRTAALRLRAKIPAPSGPRAANNDRPRG